MSQDPLRKFLRWLIPCLLALTLGTALLVSRSGPPRQAKPGNDRVAHANQTHATPQIAGKPAKPTTPAAIQTANPVLTADQAAANPPPATPPAKAPVLATNRDLPADFLDRIVSGKSVSFTLPDGRLVTGNIEMIKRDAHGILFAQGRTTQPDPGFYFFQRQTVPGVAGPLVGNLRFDGKDDAWRIDPTGSGGAARLVAHKIDEIICANYAKMPEADRAAIAGDVENVPQNHPTNIPLPPYQTVIPLQSLPGATGVIYLDFDGEPGPFPGWGSFDAAPSGASNSQIFDVWKMVCEDYQGFNLNITTDRKVFDNAPEGRRQHCIITPTTTAASGAGGVSYVGSYNWSGDRVNWAFYSTGKDSCEVIAHECGHALGLSHDGRISPSEGYYAGQGSGTTGWAPIMGVGYYQNLSQWSKGEYLSANQTQDDLSIIANNNNNVGYRTDDTGDTLATAKYLEIATDNTVSNEGIIETTGDIDAFRFVTTGGLATLNSNTVTLNPDLDILAEIVNASTNVVVVSDNPDLGINASVSATLAAGEYLLRIRGTGRGDPLVDGYTNYGSLGSYLITGSVVGGIKPVRFSIAENTATGTAVGTITPRNNHGTSTLVYAIASGNTNGTFAINSATGALTVATSAALDFEALSPRWDDPATIEMFVTITDAANPTLDENLRTVVTVTDVNEAPTITGGSATIIEHTYAGSKVFKVSGSDPDHYDFVTFSITAGNAGNVFTIDSGTGQITVTSDISVTADTVYNLTVRAADQGSPSLSVTANVAITVVNSAAGYQPGRIVRTYFENISGSTVANLTGNANFPNNPDSQEYLTAFDGQTHGDNYGSTVRGYLIPPTTGTYQFWIASDDASELRLSTNATPASATVRASVAGYTNPYDWTANSSQQAATVTLTAGQAYYIEARHKEGGGGDHVSVAWTGPGITRQVIPGLYLSPYYQNYAPKVTAATFTVRENAYVGQPFGAATATDVNTQDTFSGYTITGGNTGGVFGIVPASGQLYVAQAGLLNATTTPSYTLTLQTTDNGTPALNGSGTVTVNVVAATTINVTGIVQEIWNGIGSGTAVTDLTGNANYPNKPSVRRTLTSFDSGTDYGDNYGSRIRAKFIPPTSGAYVFYIASDDASRLLFGASGDGSGAAQIASVSGWTNHNVWTTYSTQTSTAKTLVAGQAVYLETLHKEGGGGDHVSVGYTSPDVTTVTVIPGSMLQPFNINTVPVFSPTSYSYNVNIATVTTGTVLGSVTASDANGETMVYAILSGNTAGAYAINSATGSITIANRAALANGDTTLQVGVQDGGLGGVYPLASATAAVVVHVTGGNHAPVFTSNPLTKPAATEGVAYSQTLTGTATDADTGDTLTFAKTSGPAWLAAASNGTLTGTPGNSDDGANSFVVRVTDTSGAYAETTLNINVTPVNDAPVFTYDPINIYALKGQPISGSLLATDVDVGDTMTFSKVSGPSWLSVASNGTLAGTPSAGNVGANVFTVRVTDSAGALDAATLNITVVTSPTWNNPAGGSWTTAGNWVGGFIGSGTGVTADFSTLDLTSDAAVTLDAARTIGNMVFGDTSPGNGWTLNPGTGGVLTLDNGTNQPLVTINTGTTTTIGAVVAGSNGFTKAGAGTLILTGANTFTGTTTVNAGTLNVGGGGATGAIPASPLAVASGATLAYQFSTAFTAPAQAVTGNLSYTSAAQLGMAGTYGGYQLTATGANVRVNGSLTINAGADDARITGTSTSAAGISSGGLRNITGTGNVTLTGTTGTGQYLDGISLAGVFTATTGTLTLDGTAATGGAYGIESGVSGSWAGTISTFGNVVFKGTGGGGGSGGHDSDLNLGNLTGNGNVTLIGRSRGLKSLGTFTATGGLPYNVTLQTTAGHINGLLGAGTDTTGNGNYTINSAAGVVLSGRTINAGTGTISLTSALGYTVTSSSTLQSANLVMGDTRTIGISTGASFTLNTTGTISNVISGAGNLAVTGGTVTLGGVDTYSGTTNISAGNLTVNGSLAAGAGVNIAAGATLAGTGTLAGTVSNNGTLSPGVGGPGNLAINNTLTLAAGSAIAWQLADWTGTAGTGYDLLTVTVLNITATAANPIAIQISEQALAHFAETGTSFTLIRSSSAITGFDPAKFSINTSGFTTGHGTWSIQQSGNNLMLAYVRVNPDANSNGILDTWETANFGNANPASNSADADADGDGISNLMEYALGTNPLQANGNPLVTDVVTVGTNQYLRLTVSVNPAAINLVYTVEVCSDLASPSWNSASTLVDPDSPPNVLCVRDTVPINSATRRFIRLKVSTKP